MNEDQALEERKAATQFIDTTLQEKMEEHGLVTEKQLGAEDGPVLKHVLPIEQKLKDLAAEMEKLEKEYPDVIREYMKENVAAAAPEGIDFNKEGDAEVLRVKEQEIAEQKHAEFLTTIKGMVDDHSGKQIKFTFSMDHLDRGLYFSKTGIAVASNTPGAAVQAGRPFFVMKQGNPIRPYIDSQQTTEASVTNPKLAQISINPETSVPNVNANTNYVGADPTSTTHALVPYPVRYPVSEKSLMHIPTLQNRVLMLILNALAASQGNECYLKLTGATGIQTVTSGTNDALPTQENLISKLNAMIGKVPPQYRMSPSCCFQISTKIDELMRGAYQAVGDKTKGLGMIPLQLQTVNGVTMFGGFPWVPNDHFASAGAAGAKFGMFGNFFEMGIIYEDPMTEVRMYYETNPGQIVFFTNPSWVTVPQEVTKAGVVLIEGA